MAQIYVLRLESGKYYVGKSDDVDRRYQQHLAGKGSAWTRKYKPLGLETVVPSTSAFDEDKITKEYMLKYGIDKVRGGSYVEIDLDDSQRDSLQREIWGAEDACSRCGRIGHFVKNCKAYHDIHGNSLTEEVWQCEKCDKEFDDEEACKKHERYCRSSTTGSCYRCGRKGHYSPDCYASKHIKGYALD